MIVLRQLEARIEVQKLDDAGEIQDRFYFNSLDAREPGKMFLLIDDLRYTLQRLGYTVEVRG